MAVFKKVARIKAYDSRRLQPLRLKAFQEEKKQEKKLEDKEEEKQEEEKLEDKEEEKQEEKKLEDKEEEKQEEEKKLEVEENKQEAEEDKQEAEEDKQEADKQEPQVTAVRRLCQSFRSRPHDSRLDCLAPLSFLALSAGCLSVASLFRASVPPRLLRPDRSPPPQLPHPAEHPHVLWL